MKTAKILFLFLCLIGIGCEKIDNDAPDCLKDIIKHSSDRMFICETGASVSQYSFQGKYVFVFDPGNCGADMQAPVYSEDCQLLGNLGGFVGNLIINGERFDQKATFIKTVWTD
jgi:hypothetical protein